MNTHILKFLDFLENEDDEDYGDFKREVDLHLLALEDSMRPLSREQVWQLDRIREQLLWSYQDDVGEMRNVIKREMEQLDAHCRSAPSSNQ